MRSEHQRRSTSPPPENAPPEVDRFCRFLGAAFWIAALAGLAHANLLPGLINHDAGLNLVSAQVLLDGGRPYVDFVDTNPPMIVYLSAVPVFLSRLLGMHAIPVFSSIVLILAVGVCLGLKRSFRTAADPRLRQTDIRIFLFLVLCVTVIYRIYERDRFGQRDHILILLLLPLFITRWKRWEGGTVTSIGALSAGLAAGLATCMKPHYLIAFLLPEIYWVVRKREIRQLRRMEVATYIVTGAAYVAHFFFIPFLHEEFVNRWLGITSRKFSVYNGPLLGTLSQPGFWLPLVLASIVLVRKPKTPHNSLIRPFAIFTCGLSLAYLLQFKGWDYHTIPAQHGVILLIGLWLVPHIENWARQTAKDAHSRGTFFRLIGVIGRMTLLTTFIWILRSSVKEGVYEQETYSAPVLGAIRLLRNYGSILLALGWTVTLGIVFLWIGQALPKRPSGGPRRKWITAMPWLVAAGAVLAFSAHNARRATTQELEFPYGIWKIILEETEENDPVLFISTRVGHSHPGLVIFNRRPGSRYVFAFPIAFFNQDLRANADGTFPYRKREEMSDEEQRFLRDLGEDIATRKPPIAFIYAKHVWPCPEGFIITEYLRHTGFFDREMKDYVVTKTAQDFQVFFRKQPTATTLHSPPTHSGQDF